MERIIPQSLHTNNKVQNTLPSCQREFRQQCQPKTSSWCWWMVLSVRCWKTKEMIRQVSSTLTQHMGQTAMISCWQLWWLLTAIDKDSQQDKVTFDKPLQKYCNRATEETFKLFFQAIRAKCGTIQCETFMSDIAPQFYNAWRLVMGECPHRLHCAWHVDKSFQEICRSMSD